jgi:hypothetical protein
MKNQFIAGVLILALGLVGCGSGETVEVIATSATTTAISPISTAAETITTAKTITDDATKITTALGITIEATTTTEPIKTTLSENVTTYETIDLSGYGLPVIDGSLSTVALEAALISGYTGLDFDSVKNSTIHNGTDNAFERLYNGTVDIVFIPYYEKVRIDAAKEYGIDLLYEPIAFGMYRTPEEFNYMDSGLVYYCLYFNKGTQKQSTLDFVDFVLSSKGQAYVSLGDFSPILEVEKMPVEKTIYETLGTGELRPENYKKSDKYSSVMFNRSNYGSNFEDHNRIEFFLLNDDLTDTDLENRINEWIKTEITENNLTEKFLDCVVHFISINGYLEVVISQTHGEGGGYMPDSPVSVWNLKTGEQITRLSDLFYEGTDFLPKLKEAYLTVFPNRYASEIQTEPERFFVTDFLYGDDSFNYISDEYGGETSADEYKLPIKFLSDVMEYSPVWSYCDVTPFFTERHLNNPDQWRRIRDHSLNVTDE